MSEQSPQPQSFESYFAEQPAILEKYIPGEPVTRARFTDMLITSFNRSRGDPTRQALYLSWVEARSDFSWEPALKMFIDSSGWDKLTEAEHICFLNRFMAIKAHEFSPIEGEKWRNMLVKPAEEVTTQIDILYTTIDEHPRLRENFQKKYKPFAKIMTEREFGRALDHFYPPFSSSVGQNGPEKPSPGTHATPWYTSFIQRLLAAIHNP